MDKSSQELYDTILNSRKKGKDNQIDYPLEDLGLSEEALGMVVAEDERQLEIWGRQTHKTYKWLAILSEEFGELSNAILRGSLKDIIREATHVATVALKIAWMARRKLED